MNLEGRVSFSFYAVDIESVPDIVIDLKGQIEFTERPNSRETKSVVVMVRWNGPTSSQLTAMAKLTKGRKGHHFASAACKFASSVSAISKLLPNEDVIRLHG